MASQRHGGAQKERQWESVCSLQRPEQSLPKRLLSYAEHRSTHKFHNWSRIIKLLDAYSGYNQIKMDLGTKKKLHSLSTGELLLQCHVIRLKNTRAMYQGLVTRMFQDYI